MSNRDVTITISAKDNFSAVMTKYKNAVKQSRDETDKIKESNKSMKDSFTDVQNVVQGVFGAAVLQKFAQTVGHLNEIGIGANKAEKVFVSLTKNIGGYENALAQLRQTTGGVVSDTLLMESSNKLLLSGLATNQQELNKIIEIATKLGSAMGEDAASSIQNFSLMLLNQSIPRLDSFGISGAKVRAEMEKLIETGKAANREEAFKMATFAEAANAMDTLGDSVDVGVTAFDKIGTSIRNATDDLGQFVAKSLEAGAQLALLGGQAIDMSANGQGGDFLQTVIDAVISEITHNPMATVEWRNQAEQNNLNSPYAMPRGYYINADNTSYQMQSARYSPGTQGLSSGQIEALNAKRWESQGFTPYDYGSSGSFAMTSDQASMLDQHRRDNDAAQQAREIAELTKSVFDKQFKTTLGGASLDIRNAAVGGRGNFGLMTPESISEIQKKYAEILEISEDLEQSQWLDDNQRDIMDGILLDAKDFADEAERAQKAFENMSLSELFGQSNGGRLGELGDLVAQNIEDPEARAAYERELNLVSGRETDISVAFEEKFAPLLGDVFNQFGEEIGIQATQAALNALEQGQLEGLSSDEIMARVQSSIGFNYSGNGAGVPFDVRPGDTPIGLAGSTGLTAQQIMETAGNGQFIFPGSYSYGEGGGELVSTNTAPALDEIEQSISGIQEGVEIINETPIEPNTDVAMEDISAIEEYLITLANTPYEVEVVVKVDDSELTELGLVAPNFGGGSSVRRNGGSVAGEDPRTPQKPWD